MKMTIILVMLLLMGIAVCPKGIVFAEEIEPPEMTDGSTDVKVFDIGTINLKKEIKPEPEPEPDDENEDEPAE